MNFLDAVPAIRRLETSRDDLLAIDVVGHVSAADGENLFGLMEAAYALHPHIDVLVRLVDHDGVDWANIAEDTLKQGTAHAMEHVGRCATIGEPDWTADAQHVLRDAPSIEFKHFETEDEASAWQWLGARPTEKQQGRG
ncbi:STAS/SEC14 domain-containing protein [Mesorhizobium sangaii]|uniref:STAS/SEC14 domain-containing protein n=1 Tax=Mesorhizobium sangaii TaxID=505389 RepID=A0A841PJV9_9HYPH|nr:STAS/SEC14 domain-containing protein [Mesorhizobium sangaii]MBB6410452.1 hypothetical protein [Mesorhizobium sangaii]